MIPDPWSGSWKSHDPDHEKAMIRIKYRSKIFDLDQILHQIFLIRIKNFMKIFWSGSKIPWKFFDPDQKLHEIFLIRIKNHMKIFWSGSKICHIFFDPDQKFALFFLIRIKKSWKNFWSRIKKFEFGSKKFMDQKMIHGFDPWSPNRVNLARTKRKHDEVDQPAIGVFDL